MTFNRLFELNPIQLVLEQEQMMGGALPSLLYITKQQFDARRHDRLMHSHHALCEIILVYRGAGSYVVNSQQYPVQAGDILFYNQDDTHELRVTQDAAINTYCFAFSNLKFKALPENCIISKESDPVRASGSLFQLLLSVCEQAYQLLDTDPMGRAAAQCFSLAFLLLAKKLETEPPMLDSERKNTRLADDIRQYLDNHYIEKLTLQSIAERFKCSEPYISHIFKQAIGFSPIQYVIRRRIGLAQSYLASSDYTATQISTLVGYDNTNYFNTIFTKMVGTTPIQYRKRYQEVLRHGKELQ